MNALIDAVERGEDLLRLTADLARATRGRFDGLSATVLTTARSYAQAGLNAFLALAYLPEMTEAQRLACSQAARAFRDALGTLATYFAGGDTVLSLAELGRLDPKKPDRIAGFFGTDVPMVNVTAAARDALDGLHRDPLELAALGQPVIEGLLLDISAGVAVRAL